MELGKVYCDGVTVGARPRQLDEAKVTALATSMEAIGLQQPISIWSPSDDEVHLVAGAHRLAAAIKRGWYEIDCIYVRMDEIDRQIWEIDENLYRNELTTEEMRDHLRRRKELWEQRQVGRDVPPAKLKDGRGAGPQHQKSFAAETAESTGLSKRQINRLIAEPKPKSRRGDTEDPENFVTAFLLKADAVAELAVYDGPSRAEVIDAACRVANAWSELVVKLQDRAP